MTVDDDCVFFSGIVRKFLPHDTIYCFNTAKNQVTNSILKEGEIVSTPNGLRYFIISLDDDNHIVYLKTCLLNKNSLEHNSEQTILSENIDKKGEYTMHSCISPDSSKIGFLLGIDYNDNRDQYFIVYDRLSDDFEVKKINFKLSNTYYTILDYCLTDEGKMFIITESRDKKRAQKANSTKYDANLIGTDGNVEKVTFPLNENYRVHDYKCLALHNGKILWGMIVANDKNNWTDEYLYYSIINPNDFDITDVKEYKFQDVWLEKQKVSFKKYYFISLDNLVELDNGKVYATGFPRKIMTVCNRDACWNVNSWGGFYCLGITENGDVDDFNYIERMAKKMRSDLSTLSESNFWYDAVPYGNNLYITFNEAVKKIEKGKITASVSQKDKKAYLMMYRVGEDGLKEFNLSGSAPSDRLFNSYIGRHGNKLYYLTRNNEMGSVSYVEMPEVPLKDFTRKTSQKKVSKANNSTNGTKNNNVSSSTAKKSNSVRNRKIKK